MPMHEKSYKKQIFLSVGEKWMRDKRTPKDVCGEATSSVQLHKKMLQGCCFISQRTWKTMNTGNNLMQGHMLLQQFCPCKHPQKLNKLSCPGICVKWIIEWHKNV